MIISRDTIRSKIASHIIEDYPYFVEFLEAYYEWLNTEGSAYHHIKNHLDYITFKQSLDDYVDAMKQEYLSDVPENVLISKELFIKWSRKFNLARGSHASYKFLFRVLFNEQDTTIYLPKDNILKTSDGLWVSGETLMLVSNSTDSSGFLFQRIFQERELYPGVIEYAYANVQRARTKYSNRYNVTELVITDIEGEFKQGWPIETESGMLEWLIPTTQGPSIVSGGINYIPGQRVTIDDFDTFDVERVATVAGEFDTRITSFLSASDIALYVNDVVVAEFTYDGRTVSSDSIEIDDTVTVEMPTYQGYIIIDDVDENGTIVSLDVIDTTIGGADDKVMLSSGFGSGIDIMSIAGVIKPVKGYYQNTRGHLSSNMYLQDSNYYQNYSYVIKTQQNIDKYSEIVQRLLHPAGFKMIGEINYYDLLNLIFEYISEDVETVYNDKDILVLPKYGSGGNYSFIDKFKHGLSGRLYTVAFLQDIDMRYLIGEEGYDLESSNLAKLTDYEYSNLKGWMSYSNLSDYDLHVEQDYIDEVESGYTFFESGYISDRTA